MSAPKNRTRRSPDQLVADLQAKIAKIKAKAEQAKVKKDPALRHISGAVRSIDKALAETRDGATRSALAESRATLSACLALHGGAAAGGGTLSPRARRAGVLDPERVLGYLEEHPGSRSEEIAGSLGADAATLRSALHRLRDEGKIKVEGKARATRYTATK
jgi:hypothetical protein